MKNYVKTTLAVILSAFVFCFTFSCSTTRNVFDSKDVSYIYNPTNNPINPLFNVFNETDSESVLSIKLFTNELYFSEANPLGVPTAMLYISVILYNIDQGRTIADTAVLNPESADFLSVVLKVPVENQNRSLFLPGRYSVA